MSSRVSASWRRYCPLLLRALLILAALFVLGEVGIRLLTPDAVRYDVQISTNGGPAITRAGTITDPATIARWRAAVTQTPSRRWLTGLSL